MDGNLTYLEELAQEGGNSLIDQEIEIETFGLDLTFSEETDYTLPLTKQVTTKFKGFSHQTETVAIDSEFGELKVITKSLLGLVDAIFITELFGELFPNIGEENSDFFVTLFSGKLTLDYKIHDVYDDNILFAKIFSLSLNGGFVYSLSPGSKFEIAYRYFSPEGGFGSEIPHEVKFTVQENFFSFSPTPTTTDFPIIERFTLNTEGNVDFLNTIIILENLPGEDDANFGQLYEDESGFIKIKRNLG